MRWDWWEVVGLIGEGLFFARMIVQWVASEKVRKPVIPAAYWYMSLAGAAIMTVYAFHIGSLPVLMPQLIGSVFYARGLHLEFSDRRNRQRRDALGMDRPDFRRPSVSVVVPVHNEEKTLSATLESLVGQDYPATLFSVTVALNGCVDASRREAEAFPVAIVESAESGMSFGKNLGASASGGEILVFVDADTALPPNALRLLSEAAAGRKGFVGTVAGRPDRGGAVVRFCFRLANLLTRRNRAHAPGGVMVMDRGTFEKVGGFDEALPQGTSTDFIWRAAAAGAEYVFVDSFYAVTSIRRFEKTGVIGQMLSWRRNHRSLARGRRGDVAGRPYGDVR